jgi:hexosaminidase
VKAANGGSLMLLAAVLALHLIPRPAQVEQPAACPALAPPLTVSAGFDPGALEELNERWRALGIGTVRSGTAGPAISVTHDGSLSPQAYRLVVRAGRANIESGGTEGTFYAAMTLAQLPRREDGAWRIPCVSISDRPALQWRVLSDDVSRGPLPTMRYFKERIRTIAAFKMNGYSPYMEHVFVSPTDPLPAPLDGITPAQLRELGLYAARFHVALIPEQQTFAHMHNTLRLEQYAPAAEFPHGFLLAPNVALSSEYLSRIVGQELEAVPHPPFFHIGSDETATLGLGATQAYVAQRGRSQAYADHIVAMNQLVKPSGARIMLWDDGIEADPAIMKLIPRDAVIVNWHYDDRPSFMPFIRAIARGGFEQMVAPGDSNWNEIFPDVDYAMPNERTFINEGKSAHVLGLFQTVWHDDGETLYEATWYPLLYGAAASWEAGDVTPERYAADFPAAFFGVDDPGYSNDVAALGRALTRMEAHQNYQTDPLFWSPIFNDAVEARLANVDVSAVRLDAEAVEKHLYGAAPPLHANAAAVMFLAARRYDALARKFQIAKEVRAMYADAVAHAAEPDGPALRDLFWSRYWMWEMRDAYEDLAPLYARAWSYESRDGHLASNLERYHAAAQHAIALGDAFYRVTYDGYLKTKTLPPLNDVLTP